MMTAFCARLLRVSLPIALFTAPLIALAEIGQGDPQEVPAYDVEIISSRSSTYSCGFNDLNDNGDVALQSTLYLRRAKSEFDQVELVGSANHITNDLKVVSGGFWNGVHMFDLQGLKSGRQIIPILPDFYADVFTDINNLGVMTLLAEDPSYDFTTLIGAPLDSGYTWVDIRNLPNSPGNGIIYKLSDSLKLLGYLSNSSDIFLHDLTTGETILAPESLNAQSASTGLADLSTEGVVVGGARIDVNGTLYRKPFLWTPNQEVVFLNQDDESVGLARGINDSGVVIGEFTSPSNYGFIYTKDEGIVRLDSLLPAGFRNSIPSFINNNGQIAAQVEDNSGRRRCVLLDPVKE